MPRALAVLPLCGLLLEACGDTSGGGSSEGTGTSDGSGSSATGSSGAGSTTSSTGGSTSSTSGAGSSASGTSTSGGGSGCGAPPPFTGRMSVELDVDGTARTYELSIPAEYDPATPYPVVFAFHGRGGDGALAALYFGVEAQAAGAAIFVYPDGLPLANMGNQTGWDLTANGVDVAFFDALRAELDAQLCLDPERLFATGHSFGGYFSNTLGCARGDVLRAIAPVAGGGPFFTCNTPVAAWIAHGNLDETVPVSEGEGSRDTWLGYDGCGATSQPTSPAPCVAYDGCSAGTPVVWCAHDEPDMGGHAWPSFAAEGIWGFFAGL